MPANETIVPVPRVPVSIRVATMEDIPFMDALQKKNGRAVGFMTGKMLEGYIDTQSVLIAENVTGHSSLVTCGGAATGAGAASDKGQVTSDTRLGYVISRDRYLKRDELGIIYQLNVAPEARRMLVGAALVREVFARSAYGCRLYCLWCAQDLEANRFWEAMGFVPIAFRSGSSGKKRVHIFWQRRIDEGDETTQYWYPYQTNQGAIREDRLVLPIPPGVHWGDVRAVELGKRNDECGMMSDERKTGTSRALPGVKRSTHHSSLSTHHSQPGPGPGMVGILVGGRIKYVPRPGYVAPAPAVALPVPPSSTLALPEPKPKPKRDPKPKAPRAKLDPTLLKKVREFRDRWLDYVGVNGLPSAALVEGKYDVARMLPNAPLESDDALTLPSPGGRGKKRVKRLKCPRLHVPGPRNAA